MAMFNVSVGASMIYSGDEHTKSALESKLLAFLKCGMLTIAVQPSVMCNLSWV